MAAVVLDAEAFLSSTSLVPPLKVREAPVELAVVGAGEIVKDLMSAAMAVTV
ncbi:unannotated protein [freshwater metagenome]|uniref:Unannotated protein n=1 Tax=freshwater metagenome TaxID=449393 RepID=A0A6J7K8Y5_9ZZZZ